MSVTVELKISYFSTASYTSVEYTVTEDFYDLREAEVQAPLMVEAAQQAAYEDEAMMDTFYYEYDYLMDPSYLEVA